MSRPPWSVRAARPSDRTVLASFRCAVPTVAAWQLEVEDYIQRSVLDWALAPLAAVDDPRLLLVFGPTTSDLVGVAAHERAVLVGSNGAKIQATKIQVVAVATKWQGQTFADNVRASDVVTSAAMGDIAARVPPRNTRVFAVVHEENVRSLALCRRYGLVEELGSPAPSYRRWVTAQRA